MPWRVAESPNEFYALGGVLDWPSGGWTLSGTEATSAGFEYLLGPRHAPSGFASSVSIEAEILSVSIGLVRGA